MLAAGYRYGSSGDGETGIVSVPAGLQIFHGAEIVSVSNASGSGSLGGLVLAAKGLAWARRALLVATAFCKLGRISRVGRLRVQVAGLPVPYHSAAGCVAGRVGAYTLRSSLAPLLGEGVTAD